MRHPASTGRSLAAALLFVLAVLSLLSFTLPAVADEPPEYRLKAAFLFNFALFTEWPAELGGVINLCIAGTDPFGKEIDALRGKAVGSRAIEVKRNNAADTFKDCQIVFIAPSAIGTLPQVLETARGRPVLTVADSVGAARRGVALNLAVNQNKVSFEVNLQTTRAAGLPLSSRLLRLATEVYQ
jgi:YfiR/HmsC-like